MARILVLDGHSAAALAFTRSLGRAGHWVAVGANRGIFAAAELSRFCQCRLRYPASTHDTEAFVASVAEFVRVNRIELVLPVTDWTTIPLSRCGSRLGKHCRVAVPAPEVLELVSDKQCTLALARSLGIPVPDTWLIESLQDLDRLPGFGFPMVVKDRSSVRWLGNRAVLGSVAYAYTSADLQRKVEVRLREAGDVLVQRFLSGTGVGFSCFAVDGEIYLPFQWERVREIDPRGSGSSARKSVALDSRILKLSRALVLGVGFQGIAMVEYKRESATGRLVLMEMNGRPWGSIQLAIASGIDYPRHLADWHLSGMLPPRENVYKQGLTCRRMVGELTHLENLRRGRPHGWVGQYPRFWDSLARILVPWYPGMRYDDLSFSDPRPGVAGIVNWLAVRMKGA